MVVCGAGSITQLELAAIGLEQLLDLAGHAARDDQRAPAEPRGLQRAVEGAAARAPRAVREDVDRHVADGRVVEVQACSPLAVALPRTVCPGVRTRRAGALNGPDTDNPYTKSNRPANCSAC